jgi:protein-S-isoprenylcysteine O-methyltransferase Ste14
MDKMMGFLTPVAIMAVIFILNAFLPGRWVSGYIPKPGSPEKMRYHLNGIFVFLVMVGLWVVLGITDIVSFDYLYHYRWYGLAGACMLGIIFSLVMVLPRKPVRQSLAADLFFGRTENLQLLKGRVDIKMWLYLAGATMLELNVLSFTAYHLVTYGDASSSGIILSASLLTYFLVEYLIFEEVHLYTYDLFAERIGFKLGWGCIVFYPYFYPVALWSTVALPDPGTPVWLLVLYAVIFFSGWVLARGANLQKYFFKRDPERSFLGIEPRIIGDGNKKLLVNGFWGISRHINYLGEILMATGIILCTGYPGMIWPWLYPLYYVLLLFTRQNDDDRRCSAKYGELWNEYKKRVPWRIIPHIW